jgi:hypothetical protein
MNLYIENLSSKGSLLTTLILSEMQYTFFSGFLALTVEATAPLVTLLFFNGVLAAVVVHRLSFFN